MSQAVREVLDAEKERFADRIAARLRHGGRPGAAPPAWTRC